MTNPRTGRPALLLAAVLTFFVVSCGDGDDTDDAFTPSPAAAGSPSADETPFTAADESSLGLEDAAAAALTEVDESWLLSIETEQGRTVWEVTVVTEDGTEHEMLISYADGELLDGPTKKIDDREDQAENLARVRSAELDYRAAVKAITQRVPNARLLELNLDTFDDRITAWEGELYGSNGVRYSVTIDAGTGDVLERDADAADDD